MNAELTDVHLIYGLVEGNAQATERLYHKRYSQRDAPDCQIFTNLYHNLHEYGSLQGNWYSEDGQLT